MQKMQEEIAQLEVTGESGAGLVKVTINGAHNCRRVEIDPSLLEDDKEMLEDTVAAAFNDAARRIEETQKEKMASVSSGMQLPLALRCRSDANQPAVNTAYGSTALSAGRWPEVGAAYGVHAASARS